MWSNFSLGMKKIVKALGSQMRTEDLNREYMKLVEISSEEELGWRDTEAKVSLIKATFVKTEQYT